MRILLLISFIGFSTAAAAGQDAKRLPVPDLVAQAKAHKTIKDGFAADYAKKKSADLVALSSKLLKIGQDSADDPLVQFVLLRESKDLAARGGNAELASSAIKELADRFEINVPKFKLEMLETLDAGAVGLGSSKNLLDLSSATATEAVLADEYEVAVKVLKLTGSSAVRAKNYAAGNALTARAKDVERIQEEYKRVKPDLDKVKALSNDPAECERAGRFLCFYKGDWEAGLPVLAKAKDEAMRQLAVKDSENPQQAAARVAVADEWWKFAAALPKPLQTEIQSRAGYWYKQAVADLSGLTKIRVESRIAEVEKLSAQKTTETPKVVAKTAPPANPVGPATSEKSLSMPAFKANKSEILGQLNPGDPIEPRHKRPAKTYTVELKAGKSYVIDLISQQFDALMILQDPSGVFIAQDDDGGGNLNSRIQFTCRVDGRYRIVATTFNGGFGAFGVRVTQVP